MEWQEFGLSLGLFFPCLLMSRTPANNDLLLLTPGTIYHQVWPFFWTHAEWTVFSLIKVRGHHEAPKYTEKYVE